MPVYTTTLVTGKHIVLHKGRVDINIGSGNRRHRSSHVSYKHKTPYQCDFFLVLFCASSLWSPATY